MPDRHHTSVASGRAAESETGDAPSPTTLGARIREILSAGNRIRGAGDQRVLLAVSAVVFVGATVVAARSLPPIENDIGWGYFVAVALLGVPARTWVTAEEFGVLARLTGHQVGRRERMTVALNGIAANLLPIPGSVLVRGQALRRRGASVRTIGWATFITAAMWAATTALVAGLMAGTMSDARVLGGGFAAAGALGCVVTWLMIRRRVDLASPDRHAWLLFVIEILFIAIAGLRLWAVMLGLGFDVGIDQAVALTIAGVITAAVGFAPGGLGIRELMAAVISPLVGLPASLGVLAAALNRLIEIAVLAPVSIGLILHPERIPDVDSAAADEDLTEAPTGLLKGRP